MYFFNGQCATECKIRCTIVLQEYIFPVVDSTLFKGQLLTNELRRHLFSLLSSWCSKSGTSPPVEKYVFSYNTSDVPDTVLRIPDETG